MFAYLVYATPLVAAPAQYVVHACILVSACDSE